MSPPSTVAQNALQLMTRQTFFTVDPQRGDQTRMLSSIALPAKTERYPLDERLP
jgi:hypothetical protein